MKLDLQVVLAQVDRLIEQAAPGDLPTLAAILSTRVGMAAARMLEAKHEPVASEENGSLLTVPETAKRLRLRTQRVYELIRQGELPHVRIGPNQIRVSLPALTRWLAQREQ